MPEAARGGRDGPGAGLSQFSSALHGTGNLGVTWLWAQSDAFLMWFITLLVAARQLTPAASRERRAARIGEFVALLLED